MFWANGKLVIRKPFYTKNALYSAYMADHALHGETSPFVLHFRYSTHGDKGTENVHPHSLADGTVGLVHNGILDDFEPPYKSTRSDTAHFCGTVLAFRSAEQLMSAPFAKFMADTIGGWNKFVLMDSIGSVRIVNQDAGLWEGPYWYSNNTYLRKVPAVQPAIAEAIADRDFATWADRYRAEDRVTFDDDTPWRYHEGLSSQAEYDAYCEYYGMTGGDQLDLALARDGG